MNLLRSTENKVTKYKNGESITHLEITEVVLVHCNNVNNEIQEFCIHLFQVNDLANY